MIVYKEFGHQGVLCDRGSRHRKSLHIFTQIMSITQCQASLLGFQMF